MPKGQRGAGAAFINAGRLWELMMTPDGTGPNKRK